MPRIERFFFKYPGFCLDLPLNKRRNETGLANRLLIGGNNVQIAKPYTHIFSPPAALAIGIENFDYNRFQA